MIQTHRQWRVYRPYHVSSEINESCTIQNHMLVEFYIHSCLNYIAGQTTFFLFESMQYVSQVALRTLWRLSPEKFTSKAQMVEKSIANFNSCYKDDCSKGLLHSTPSSVTGSTWWNTENLSPGRILSIYLVSHSLTPTVINERHAAQTGNGTEEG